MFAGALYKVNETIKCIMQRRTKDITLKTVIIFANGLRVSASEFLGDPAFSAENLDLDG